MHISLCKTIASYCLYCLPVADRLKMNEQLDKKDNFLKGLYQIIDEQAKIIDQLKANVIQLKEEIHLLKNPKNSHTGSVPPSKDENRKTKSLRQKTGRKTGGQKGHKGHTLELSKTPDDVVVHLYSFCQRCGKDIRDLEGTLRQKRQVVDLPVVRAMYTEHQCYDKVCGCGHINKSEFPKQVNARVQYGVNVEAQVAYMSTRQYMPYGRIAEFFKDAYGLPLSQGSVDNLLERFAGKAILTYQRIQENISKASVVGADETGAKINGKRAWVHTWQNTSNTFLAISTSRGNLAIQENFPNGFPSSILVSDAWAAQLATPAKFHQLCLAHLLRELNHFIEIYQQKWSADIKSVLLQAIGLKKEMKADHYHYACQRRDKIEERLDRLLERSINEKHKKMIPFKKRLIKNRKAIFQFLYHLEVPADNNASERAIRNVKVKQKVSAQFKSFRGAEIFVIIRSVINTAIKRNRNVLECLKLNAEIVPE